MKPQEKTGYRPDFILEDDYKIEIKAIPIGRRSLKSYFDNKKRGLIKDFLSLKEKRCNLFVIFVYSKSPININEWNKYTKEKIGEYKLIEYRKILNDNFLISFWKN